ncbi:uncharacterized protein LOC118644729 [Monomorium pharaonis]|uniref:uncharacterized protein LOC118644729 n=1 Tax=Monomorium pharaonis TaxID=307658 RepID=UPI00174774D5|nr:uncharacterized protein LOC118644729 [Monomorium pharaonis]
MTYRHVPTCRNRQISSRQSQLRINTVDKMQFNSYTPIYTNNKIIAKPPVKALKESLGSALDSFYNDIACIEKTETERIAQQDVATVTEQVSTPMEKAKSEMESETAPNDTAMKERKKKKKKLNKKIYQLIKHSTLNSKRGSATAKNTRGCQVWWRNGKGYKRI